MNKLVRTWVEPKSQNPEEAFYEKLLRIISFVMLLAVLFGVYLAFSFFPSKLTFPAMPGLVIGIGCCIFLAIVQIQKQRIGLAIHLLVLGNLIGQLFILLLARYEQNTMIFYISINGYLTSALLASALVKQPQLWYYAALNITLFVVGVLWPVSEYWMEDFKPLPYTVNFVMLFLIIYALIGHLTKEAEARYKRAEMANQSKLQFLRYLNHELRTPLNTILPLTEILLSNKIGETNPKQKDYLERIHTNSVYLKRLISNVLTLSRIEAGKMELQPAWLDVPQLLREAAKNIEPQLAADVKLMVSENEGLMPIWADADRLQEVLINVLSNAAKFTEQGQIAIASTQTSRLLHITIADTGPGIPESEKHLVFEEFEQTQAGKSKSGTGLGMSISKRLIELHQGNIYFESSSQGTTFFIEIPNEGRGS